MIILQRHFGVTFAVATEGEIEDGHLDNMTSYAGLQRQYGAPKGQVEKFEKGTTNNEIVSFPQKINSFHQKIYFVPTKQYIILFH